MRKRCKCNRVVPAIGTRWKANGKKLARYDRIGCHACYACHMVLDGRAIHHGIDEATRERWLLDHKTFLFYLPAYSQKHRDRLAATEIPMAALRHGPKETIDVKLANLLAGYGFEFKRSFS